MSHKKFEKATSTPILIRRAAGCVVFRIDDDGTPLFLLIRDPYGRWTLPKGHLEGKETMAEAAVREVLEETGVHGELGALVEQISYRFTHHGRVIDKQVSFFMMRAHVEDVTPQISEGISAVAWFAAPEALRLIDYHQVRGVLQKALHLI